MLMTRNVLTAMSRIVSVFTGVPSPRTSSTRLHSLDLPAQSARRSLVLGVLLDRPRVSAGAHLSRHSHDADDHHSELGTHARNADRVLHEGNRRLDGDVSCVRVRFLHRIFYRQRARSPREDAS